MVNVLHKYCLVIYYIAGLQATEPTYMGSSPSSLFKTRIHLLFAKQRMADCQDHKIKRHVDMDRKSNLQRIRQKREETKFQPKR